MWLVEKSALLVAERMVLRNEEVRAEPIDDLTQFGLSGGRQLHRMRAVATHADSLGLSRRFAQSRLALKGSDWIVNTLLGGSRKR